MTNVFLKSIGISALITALAAFLATKLEMFDKPACDFKVNPDPNYVQGVPCSVTNELTQSAQIKIFAIAVFVAIFTLLFLFLLRNKRLHERNSSKSAGRH
jgi:hypothetical protein